MLKTICKQWRGSIGFFKGGTADFLQRTNGRAATAQRPRSNRARRAVLGKGASPVGGFGRGYYARNFFAFIDHMFVGAFLSAEMAFFPNSYL